MDVKKNKIALLAPRIAAGVSVGLAIFKITMGMKISSIAIQTSGYESLFDAIISGLSFFFLRMSLQPADEDHPYGHSRIASLTSLAQGLFLFVVVFILGEQAIHKLHQPFYAHMAGEYLVVSAVATIVTALLWVYLSVVVKQTRSPIVAADRLHYFTDVGANLLLFVGFFIGPHFRQYNVDAILALALCLFIAAGAYHVIMTSINNLVDRQDPTVEKDILNVVKDFYPRALGVERLRSRKSGYLTAVDLELVSCRKRSLEEANDLAHELEAAILEKAKDLDIFIHAEPCKKSQCATSNDCLLDLISKRIVIDKKS